MLLGEVPEQGSDAGTDRRRGEQRRREEADDDADSAADPRAGGDVTVTIACDASFADVGSIGVAGSQTFVASATEVIDNYRGN